MATRKQTQAAKRNVKQAQQGARRKRTIANLPKSTRSELGKQAARGRQRGGQAGQGAGHRGPLEDGQVGADRGDPPRALNPAAVAA
jgi:hypothetical protein